MDRQEGIELTSRQAASLILRDFPGFQISTIDKLGEGLGNVAFEVNCSYVFRFPKTRAHRQDLEREIPLLRLVARHSPLPIPAPEMIAPHHAYIGYRKLPGAPLVESGSSFCGWTGFPDQIGQYLSAIHRIPVEEVRAVHVKSEAEPWEVLLRDARGDYDRARDLIPRHYSAAIERFFASTPPSNSFEPVFCHNDLGIEHILVTETHVSGVIDWGDTAITDPARDLGLLYRDLGEDVLHRTVDAYTPPVQLSKEHLLDRAVFYAKCRIFENIVYGWNQQRPEYLDTGIQSLQWMFGE